METAMATVVRYLVEGWEPLAVQIMEIITSPGPPNTQWLGPALLAAITWVTTTTSPSTTVVYGAPSQAAT